MTITGRRSRSPDAASRTEAGVRMVERVKSAPSSSIRLSWMRLKAVISSRALSSTPSSPETNSTSRWGRRGRRKEFTATPMITPARVSVARCQTKIQGLASVMWVTAMLKNTTQEK